MKKDAPTTPGAAARIRSKQDRAKPVEPHGGKANGKAEATPRFKLVPFRDIHVSTAPAYLIKNVFPRESLIVVWGPKKSGKSFWTFDALMHVALGWEYRGRRVKQGAVVYLALEGGRGFRGRVEAWRKQHLADDPKRNVPFYLLDTPVDLIADHVALIAAIREQLGKEQNPAAITIDTLARALVGDDGDGADMSRFIRAADAIRTAFPSCSVILVHHCGLEAGRPRGHTSLPGAADTQIAVERDAVDNVVVSVEFMKDGEPGTKFVSRLEQAEVGIDDDGDPITSCIIVEVEGDPAAKVPKLTGATKIAYELLLKAIEEAGEKPPASNQIPPQIGRTCRATTWRAYCYAGTLADTDKPDAKQKAFARASKTLQSQKLIGIWSDHVWLTSNPK